MIGAWNHAGDILATGSTHAEVLGKLTKAQRAELAGRGPVEKSPLKVRARTWLAGSPATRGTLDELDDELRREVLEQAYQAGDSVTLTQANTEAQARRTIRTP